MSEPENTEQQEAPAKPAKKKAPPAALKKILAITKIVDWRIAVGGLVAALVGLFLWALSLPAYGTIELGICRTFAEIQLSNPHTFCMTSAENLTRAKGYRLYYTEIGAYGEYGSHRMDCAFGREMLDGQALIRSVTIDNRPVDAEIIAAFNKTIPIVVAANPDTSMPRPTEGLQGLRKQECFVNER